MASATMGKHVANGPKIYRLSNYVLILFQLPLDGNRRQYWALKESQPTTIHVQIAEDREPRVNVVVSH